MSGEVNGEPCREWNGERCTVNRMPFEHLNKCSNVQKLLLSLALSAAERFVPRP